MEDRENRYKGAFFSGDSAEYESAQLGMVAMMGLQEVGLTPSPERLGLLHMLRWSAKRCPSAAYNLGSYLEGSIKRSTPKRNALALKLFERAVEMCVLRLHNAYGEFDPEDADTNQVKDILSRSLTNIGVYLANTGHTDAAENYFRRSIAAYPLNDNSFICLGNIGLNYYGENGVDLLEAIAAWEEGDRLGQQVIGFGDDVDPTRLSAKMSRKRLVEVFRTLENLADTDIALEWLERRVTLPSWRTNKRRPLSWVVFEPEDVLGITPEKDNWSENAISVANIFSQLLGDIDFFQLEEVVTFSGAMVVALARVKSRDWTGSSKLVWDAIDKCEGIELYNSFLAFDDWEHRAPPETLYLQTRQAEDRIMELVHAALDVVVTTNPEAGSQDLLMGFLVHLDVSFRHGVATMISDIMEKRHQGLIYIPAMEVGGEG